MAWSRVDKVEDVVKEGDIVKVKVLELDSQGRINLSMRDCIEKPEGYTEQAPSDRGPRSGDRGDRGGDRPRSHSGDRDFRGGAGKPDHRPREHRGGFRDN